MTTDPPRYDSRPDTLAHIARVQTLLAEICAHLTRRGAVHDASKLVEPEKSGFDNLTVRLCDCAYDSPEYRAALAEALPMIQHHYAANSHHPEHFANGVDGMSLLDVVEMFCDWKAASERSKDGSLARSVEINRERLGPRLAAIFENTRGELGWE